MIDNKELDIKLYSLRVATGTAMVVLVFIIAVIVSSENTAQNQPNVTILPTTTAAITPDTTDVVNLMGIFPSIINCAGVMPPYDGPSWEWIHIGKTTFEELLDYLEILPITVTLRSYSWDGWNITFRDSDSIQQEWKICVTDDLITTFSIQYYAAEREAYVWDVIANWGTPDAVARTWGRLTRAYFWFERGIALTVFVWQDSENIEYGRITEVTYFPYVDPENYEDVYPFNQTNIVLGGLPSQPGVPLELDPLDYDAILVTVTPGAITNVIGGQ